MLSVFGRRVKGMILLRPEQVWTCNVTLHVHTLTLHVHTLTLHVHTCSGRNSIIPLMRRPNTDSTPKKPVTLPRNQLLIRYAVTSPVHTVTIRCYDTRQHYKCVPTLTFGSWYCSVALYFNKRSDTFGSSVGCVTNN